MLTTATTEIPRCAQDDGGRRPGSAAAKTATLAILAGMAALSLPASLHGQGLAAERVEKASLTLAADRTAYEAGSTARLAAVVRIEGGWHVNSRHPTYEYLIPTEVTFELPEGWAAIEPHYPTGEMKSFAFADEPLSVYEGEVAIVGETRVPAAAAPGPATILASLRYQACDDRSCLPPVTTRASLDLRLGPGGEPTGETAFAASPPPASGGGGSLVLTLLLGLLGGLILNAMPCVLPVLSLKVFGLVRSAGAGRSGVVVGALATAAGILLSFWARAVAAIGARAAGAAIGWGIQFQQPAFVAVLAVVVVLFCLNLWGLFEVQLPGAVARRIGDGGREGLAGHLASGLFATLMATPCSAPFLGTAIGFALGQEAKTVLAVFTAIGFGMALPYLVLAAAPGAARLLPRPGAWMEKLKVVMGFLLAGAAIWLFYVLSGQISPERLAFVELAMLALALFVWARGRAGGFGRKAAWLGIAASIAAVVGLAAGGAGEAPQAARAGGGELIAWTPFDRTEAEGLAREGRLVFVDVTADWCFTCKVNERLVLETPEVAAAFGRYDVVPMKADWTRRDDGIARYLAEFGRYGIPFYLLYRPGAEPHLFSELLTTREVLAALQESAAAAPARLSERLP